jgi:hypothetical protein
MAFVVGLTVFFLIITLTLILGAVSKMGDKRVEQEGRATPGQRPPAEGDVPARS